MFSVTPDPVNLDAPGRSTIARWLRRRSRALPPWQQLSMRLLPPRCLFCGQGADLGAIDLCTDCLEALPWLPGHGPQAPTPLRSGFSPATGQAAADLAAADLATADFAAIPVEARSAGIEVGVPLRFAAPVDAALRALKFQGELCPAQVFGALLAATVGRRDVPDLIVPVPLHAARLHERGFNQSAQLARQAARWLGRPLAAALLERRRSTLPQTSLEASARRRNVAGAFAPAPGAAAWLRRHPAAAGHVALVDDVLTTGATTAAAAVALQALGVARVSIWAVARPVSNSFTPAPEAA